MTDRKFLEKGVQDFWRYQENQMHAKMLKQVDKIGKEYKRSADKGAKMVTKLADDMATEQLSNATMMYKALMFTTTDNINDRAKSFRKNMFVAPIILEKAAKSKGYDVEFKTKDKVTQAILKKKDIKYVLSSDSPEFKTEVKKQKTKGKLSFAPYMKGFKMIVPFDFIQNLK